MSKTILVLGGAHMDRRGRISGTTAPGASNPGSWFEEPGGGGFNAARNLARLGHQVKMVSPRGGDAGGDMVAAAAQAAGIDDRPVVFLDRKTPSYTAILENDGNLVVALADMELYKLFTPRRLSVRALRDAIEAADLVLCDANLPDDTIRALARTARPAGRITAAIAISPAKVVRYRGALDGIDYLFMNEAEAEALAGTRANKPQDWPRILADQGLHAGAITRGRQQTIAFSQGQVFGLAPPPVDEISDVTGAGDSFAAGMLSAILRGLPFAEAMRHGAAAAVITLQSPLATAENLSSDQLNAVLGLVGEPEILS